MALLLSICEYIKKEQIFKRIQKKFITIPTDEDILYKFFDLQMIHLRLWSLLGDIQGFLMPHQCYQQDC